MPRSDLYMALKLGTVDAGMVGLEALESDKLKEIVHGYVVSPTVQVNVGHILINKDAFKKLPEDIQEIIQRDSRYFLAAMGDVFAQQTKYIAASAQKEYGLTYYTWPEEEAFEIRKGIIEEVWPEFAGKSARNAEMLELIKGHLRVFNKIE